MTSSNIDTHSLIPPFRPVVRNTDRQLGGLLAEFARTGKPLTVNFRQLVTEIANPDRATHLIHPYPAKLLVQIPYFFLASEELSSPSGVVLDPFCGSGTVLLEALLLGRSAAGADSNPLARLIASVKTTPLDPNKLRKLLKQMDLSSSGGKDLPLPDVVNLEYWFYPHVIRKLQTIRRSILDLKEEEYRRFFLVCFSSCLRRVCLADPRLSVPVRLKSDQYSGEHWLHQKTVDRLRDLRSINVASHFVGVTMLNISRMEAMWEHLRAQALPVPLFSDARKIKALHRHDHRKHSLNSGYADLIITSPPYGGAQKYVRASSLSLGWLGLCSSSSLRQLENENIGREHYRKSEYQSLIKTGIPRADKKLEEIYQKNPLRAHIAANYLCEMRDAFRSATDVLRSGGHIVLIAGNNTVCGTEFETYQYLIHLLREEFQFNLRLELVDDIRSRGLMTKRNTTAGVIATESVALLRKA